MGLAADALHFIQLLALQISRTCTYGFFYFSKIITCWKVNYPIIFIIFSIFLPISGPTDVEDPSKEINDQPVDTNNKPLNGHSKTINGDKPKEKPKPPPKPKVLVTADGKIKPMPPARATKV